MGSKCFERSSTIRKENGEENGYDLKNSNSSRTTERRAADVSMENPNPYQMAWHPKRPSSKLRSNAFVLHYSRKQYSRIQEIILPYVDKIKEELGLPKDQKSLLIYDVFKGHVTKRYTDFLLDNDLVHVHVPENLTHKF